MTNFAAAAARVIAAMGGTVGLGLGDVVQGSVATLDGPAEIAAT